jgi:hypothetical protein
MSGAKPRVDQCVALSGLSVKVLTITASTCSSSTVCGAPERYSSAKPFSRFSTNRDRHLPTVACETPTSAATAWLVLPPAQAKMIRDRNARLCGLDGRRAQRASVARSSESRISTAFGRPVRAMRTSIVACPNHPHRPEILGPPTIHTKLRIRTLVSIDSCAVLAPLDQPLIFSELIDKHFTRSAV